MLYEALLRQGYFLKKREEKAVSLLPEKEDVCPGCGKSRKVSGGRFNPMLQIGKTTYTPELILQDLNPDFPCPDCFEWLQECVDELKQRGLWESIQEPNIETKEVLW